MEQIFQYLDDRAKVTNTGTAKIDLKNLSFFEKIYNVLFGPKIFAFSMTNIVYFVDKLYLSFIFLHIFFIDIKFFKNDSSLFKLFEVSLLFFSILLCILVCLSISNYGMALRLKLMFLPLFFYFIFKKSKSFHF